MSLIEKKLVRNDIVRLIGHGNVTLFFYISNDYIRDI